MATRSSRPSMGVIGDCRLKRAAAAVDRNAFVDRGPKGRPATVREADDRDPVGLDVGQSAQINRGVVGVLRRQVRPDEDSALADAALIARTETSTITGPKSSCPAHRV